MRAFLLPASIPLVALLLASGAAAGDASPTSAQQSIARGRTLFQLHCTACHGRDGKAQIDLIANATNLTEPGAYKFGTDDAAILRTITTGSGNMPAFEGRIAEGDRQHLVSFIKSLWVPKRSAVDAQEGK